MLACFSFVREFDTLSVFVRLTLAVILGGVVGIEREYRHRPAGFRTHILICLGAAITTLTGQYLLLVLHLYTDVSRLGAQVISGIGFVGAGSIIVSRQKRIQGLTTAAGLWTCAIIGLACGAGFAEGAIAATLLILLSELLLVKLEYRFTGKLQSMNLYVEYREADCIQGIIRMVRERHIRMSDLQITRAADEDHPHFSALLSLQASRRADSDIGTLIASVEGVTAVEEL